MGEQLLHAGNHMDIHVVQQMQPMKTGTFCVYRLIQSGRVSIQWMMVSNVPPISIAGGMAGMVQDMTFVVIPIHLTAHVSKVE